MSCYIVFDSTTTEMVLAFPKSSQSTLVSFYNINVVSSDILIPYKPWVFKFRAIITLNEMIADFTYLINVLLTSIQKRPRFLVCCWHSKVFAITI